MLKSRVFKSVHKAEYSELSALGSQAFVERIFFTGLMSSGHKPDEVTKTKSIFRASKLL